MKKGTALPDHKPILHVSVGSLYLPTPTGMENITGVLVADENSASL